MPTRIIIDDVIVKKSEAFIPRANYTYWLSDRHLSTKFSAKFMDRGVSRGQGGGSPRSLISVF
jgi:hypothetical protein